MSMYVNEVNVVNQNQPPSSEKVVRQLMRKRFVGKDLVEPYTMQPPTTAPFAFFKVDRKRLKRKARMLQIQNTHISFDDDVGDDDPDFKVLSLEEWESTKLKKKRNKKEPIRQSQIALKEIPLVEFHEDLSRALYSRRTKVKLPECIDMVYALGNETSPWGNNDIFVYRSFWLNLLGLKEGGWLSDRGDIPGWVCNGVRYLIMWADVEQVFFSINEPNEHYYLNVLHIRTGVITLYDSFFSEAVETRKWWIKMRKAFKKYIPLYLQEWGILDAKGIPLESYNINFVVGKDVLIQGDAYGDCGVWVCIFLYRLIHKMAVSVKDLQIVGLAYREYMFGYFWKYKIEN
ncbi:phospholipase-like protein [Tanacetum coccineum]